MVEMLLRCNVFIREHVYYVVSVPVTVITGMLYTGRQFIKNTCPTLFKTF